MARPRLCRKIGFVPETSRFAPIAEVGAINVVPDENILGFDEFEAIRLKDLLGLEQEECAKKMSISQPTFHRLILASRKKIADALVNNKIIRIRGGNFKLVKTRK